MTARSAAAACIAAFSTTLAPAATDAASLAFDADSTRIALHTRQDAPNPADAPAPPPVFGAKGTWWGSVHAGYARELTQPAEANDVNLAFTFSTFLETDFELMLQLGAWYFDQEGDNAGGLNFMLGFRWHFHNEGPRSLFLDGGVGLLASTDLVPDEGTGFNFMPFVGAGFTHAIGDDGLRFLAGVRWHHISNARIKGEERNPSRDGVMVYAGVQFPF
ncbi:MAG: hypothetical protein EA379_02335 [Phycisphaerales bacterium]|nr:MAG: hypothetical protein EA379_02335 [Phycisphaerales bacterium]